jgi:prepilin-type N-terminal cleavage/methylation domain-containing protein
MTSKIGNNWTPAQRLLSHSSGFTFVEIMVTLVVLSIGITGIMKTYLFSLNRLSYLSNRLYASLTLDNHIAKIERMLKVYDALPMTLPQTAQVDMGMRSIELKQEMNIKSVEDHLDIFQLTVNAQWIESGHPKSISKISYLADFGSDFGK